MNRRVSCVCVDLKMRLPGSFSADLIENETRRSEALDKIDNVRCASKVGMIAL